MKASEAFFAPNDGVALSDIVTLANKSKAKNRVIILDSCHSGIAGSSSINSSIAEISEGVSILTASSAEQYASEVNGAGVFTALFVDALNGAAANLVGEITPGAVYAHIDQSLGEWAQRPVFKTNVNRFISLRKVRPPLEVAELRKIAELFPEAGFQYQLDPTYEPERPQPYESKSVNALSIPDPIPEHTAIFRILQKYNRANLLVPNDAPHMWHAAMESRTVRLTALGEHYRRLAAKDLI